MSDQNHPEELPNINGHNGDVREGSVPPSPNVRRRAGGTTGATHKMTDTAATFTGNVEDNPIESGVVGDSVPLSHEKTPISSKSFEDFKKEEEAKNQRQQRPSPSSDRPVTSTKNKIELDIRNFYSKWKLEFAVLGVFILIIGVVINYCVNSDVGAAVGDNVKVKSVRTWKDTQNLFRKELLSLNATFGAQKQESWFQLLAAVNSTLSEDEPKQPSAVVILVPPPVTREFSTCFVKTVAEAVNNAHYAKTVSKNQKPKRTAVIKEMDPDYFARSKTVTHIHDDLKEYLRHDKAVIFYDVDKIQQEEHLLVFHGFCDSSRAHDKRATYFFVISVPRDIYEEFEWTHRMGEEIAQRLLNSAWDSVLNDDKRPAVISRVLANIILLNEGDSCN